MKKAISVLLLFALLFSMVGCTEKKPEDSEKTKEIEITYNTFSEWGGGEYQIIDGELYCRQQNSLGLLGDDVFAMYEDWTKTSIEANNIIHIEVYSGILLYLTNDGKVYALGYTYEWADWGPTDGDATECITTPVLLFEDCKIASLGTRFALFLKNDNTLWFVGESLNGQSKQVKEAVSEPIKLADDVLFAKAIGYTSSWIDSEYNLYLCGDNSYGQIGNGKMGCGYPTKYEDIVEQPYCALKDCIAFSAKYEFNDGITVRAETVNGEIYVWGGSHGAKPILEKA